MGGEQAAIGFAEARSALAWWLESGVDVAVQEEARDWLKPAPTRAKASAPEPEAAPQPVHETLDEFRQWLATANDLPMATPASRRVLPQGTEQPRLMLLVQLPEDSSGLLNAEHTELVVRMLAAIGVQPEEAYTASISCFHTPGARLKGPDLEACADITRRHVRLARPERLLLFGDGPCAVLLGKPLLAARKHVHKVEGVRTVATFHPRNLVNQPSNKSEAWKDLLLLMENDS